MNSINKILILSIILFLINYLTHGKVFTFMKYFLLDCKDKINVYLNKNININKKEQNLDDFLKSLITTNNIDKLTKYSNTNKIVSNEHITNKIKQHISKVMNYSEYSFNNIVFIDDVLYYENEHGYDLLPLTFKTDVLYRNKSLGSNIITINGFLYEDIMSNDSMKLLINNIKLNDNINKKKKKKKTKKNIKSVSFENNINNIDNTFSLDDDIFFNDIELNQNNDDDLIPSNIEFTVEDK